MLRRRFGPTAAATWAGPGTTVDEAVGYDDECPAEERGRTARRAVAGGEEGPEPSEQGGCGGRRVETLVEGGRRNIGDAVMES